MREEYIREKIKEAQEVILEALEALERNDSEDDLQKFDEYHGTQNDKVIRESSSSPGVSDDNRDISAI